MEEEEREREGGAIGERVGLVGEEEEGKGTECLRLGKRDQLGNMTVSLLQKSLYHKLFPYKFILAAHASSTQTSR